MTSSPAAEPVRVFVGGTFDGLHRGHLYLLEYARRRGLALANQLGRTGVWLSVVIARDESVRRIKHRPPHHNQRERAKLQMFFHTSSLLKPKIFRKQNAGHAAFFA